MKKYEKKNNVKGFILKINSPGGGVAPSQEIYRYIRSLKKPVYAAIGSLGASGGYYVAAACDRIYALPGSITGSIGVIMKFTNFKDLYNKIGIKSVTIKSGKFKDIGSSSREMTKEEKILLKMSITDVYNQFINDIISARKIDKQTLKKYADGRILTGNQAKKIKLIDNLGTYFDAFQDMKRKLKLNNAELFIPKQKLSALEEIFGKIQLFENKLSLKSGFYYLLEM
jgi:protease-4